MFAQKDVLHDYVKSLFLKLYKGSVEDVNKVYVLIWVCAFDDFSVHNDMSLD